jgi:hypothetical protein
LPNKLQAALEIAINNERTDIPFLYGSRTTYTTAQLTVIKNSPLYIFPCSFRNALVQNILGGNTIFFNQKTKDLLEKIGPVKAISHDWWLYIIISGVGGIVIQDQNSYILYRQHKDANIGGGYTQFNRLERIYMLCKGEFKRWSDVHINLLEANKHYLTFESRQILNNFILLRNSKIGRRFRMLEICGLYRQTLKATISLYFAILFKKI